MSSVITSMSVLIFGAYILSCSTFDLLVDSNAFFFVANIHYWLVFVFYLMCTFPVLYYIVKYYKQCSGGFFYLQRTSFLFHSAVVNFCTPTIM